MLDPILARLLEETATKYHTTVEGVKADQTLDTIKPHGLELSHRLTALYGVGPVAGIDLITQEIKATKPIGQLEGCGVVYGTSFVRADTKEVIQALYTGLALRQQTGDESLKVAYFIDPSSHSLREYLEAIIFDYELDDSQASKLRVAFKTDLVKKDPFIDIRSSDQYYNLPPSFYAVPSVDDINNLPLPEAIKGFWVKALEQKPDNLGEWIVAKNRLIIEQVIKNLGYDPAIINVMSLDSVFKSFDQVQVTEVCQNIKTAQNYQRTIQQVASMTEQQIVDEYRIVLGTSDKPEDRAIINQLDQIAGILPQVDAQNPKSVQSYNQILNQRKQALFKLRVTQQGHNQAEQGLGMLCLIGCSDDDRMLIDTNYDLIYFDRKTGSRINVSKKVIDDPEGDYGATRFKHYLLICQSLKTGELTIQEIRNQYPIQPSGLGYYSTLAVIMQKAGQVIDDAQAQGPKTKRGAFIILDDYEQPIGPTTLLTQSRLNGGLVGIATPKGLIGNKGNFNVPPDIGMLLLLAENAKINVTSLIDTMKDQLLTDNIGLFSGVSLSYDKNGQSVFAQFSQIDRYVYLKLVQLKYALDRLSLDDRLDADLNNFAYALYLYRPDLFLKSKSKPNFKSGSMVAIPESCASVVQLARFCDSKSETQAPFVDFLKAIGIDPTVISTLTGIATLESQLFAEYADANQKESDLLTDIDRLQIEINYINATFNTYAQFDLVSDLEQHKLQLGEINLACANFVTDTLAGNPLDEQQISEIKSRVNNLKELLRNTARKKVEQELDEQKRLALAGDSSYDFYKSFGNKLKATLSVIDGLNRLNQVTKLFDINDLGKFIARLAQDQSVEDQDKITQDDLSNFIKLFRQQSIDQLTPDQITEFNRLKQKLCIGDPHQNAINQVDQLSKMPDFMEGLQILGISLATIGVVTNQKAGSDGVTDPAIDHKPNPDLNISALSANIQSEIKSIFDPANGNPFGIAGIRNVTDTLKEIKAILELADARVNLNCKLIELGYFGVDTDILVTQFNQAQTIKQVLDIAKQVAQSKKTAQSKLVDQTLNQQTRDVIINAWIELNKETLGTARYDQLQALKTYQGKIALKLAEFYQSIDPALFESYKSAWTKAIDSILQIN